MTASPFEAIAHALSRDARVMLIQIVHGLPVEPRNPHTRAKLTERSLIDIQAPTTGWNQTATSLGQQVEEHLEIYEALYEGALVMLYDIAHGRPVDRHTPNRVQLLTLGLIEVVHQEDWIFKLTDTGSATAEAVPMEIAARLNENVRNHIQALHKGEQGYKMPPGYVQICANYGLVDTDIAGKPVVSPLGLEVLAILAQTTAPAGQPVGSSTETPATDTADATHIIEPAITDVDTELANVAASHTDTEEALRAQIKLLRSALITEMERSNVESRPAVSRVQKAAHLHRTQLDTVRQHALMVARQNDELREELTRLKAAVSTPANPAPDSVHIAMAADLAAAKQENETLQIQVTRMTFNHKQQLDEKSDEIKRLTNQLETATRRATRAESDLSAVQATATRWQQEHAAITKLLKLLTPDDKPTYRVVEQADAATLEQMECAGWERVLMQFDSGSLRVVYRHAGDKPQPTKTITHAAHLAPNYVTAN